MSQEIRCPECGGTTVTDDGRRRCPQCGARLAYRPRWLPLLAAAIGLSLLLGVGSALLFDGKAAYLFVPLSVPALLFFSRRFRKLQKV
jgi:DNA-directed RNA polymerase subunit RPC12/RpoP